MVDCQTFNLKAVGSSPIQGLFSSSIPEIKDYLLMNKTQCSLINFLNVKLVILAEWLTRLPAKQLPFGRASSNLADDV